MLFQCCASVKDGGPTLKQHWANASCLLRVYWRVFFIHIYHHTAVHMIAARGGIGVGLWCCLVVRVSEPT